MERNRLKLTPIAIAIDHPTIEALVNSLRFTVVAIAFSGYTRGEKSEVKKMKQIIIGVFYLMIAIGVAWALIHFEFAHYKVAE